jgi:hypothetical protein
MKLTKEQTLGLIRHTLTFVGGIVLSNGLVDQATIDVIVGSVITFTGAIWNIIAKRS